MCDGVAEAVSRTLCAAYLHAYDEIRHHNVDKALLVGGQSRARFGGGDIDAGIRSPIKRCIFRGRFAPYSRLKHAILQLAECLQ